MPPQRKNKLNVITFFYPQSKEGKEVEIVLWLKTSEADGVLISFHVRESGAHKSEKQISCTRVTEFSPTSLFLERIWGEFRIHLSRMNKSVKSTDLNLIFFTFERRLVFCFDILYSEWAYRRSGDSILARNSALKCV